MNMSVRNNETIMLEAAPAMTGWRMELGIPDARPENIVPISPLPPIDNPVVKRVLPKDQRLDSFTKNIDF